MNQLLNRLERKFGRYAIHNLMKYIIGLYALGFFIDLLNPELYVRYFMFDVEKVLHGQIWRILTFLIQPIHGSGQNLFFMLISLVGGVCRLSLQ